MRAKIKYAVYVKEDIKASVNWYNKAQNGLGTRFLKNVKEKINSVAENPETFQIIYLDVKLAVVKTFPYTIHFQYNVQQNTIFILGISTPQKIQKIGQKELKQKRVKNFYFGLVAITNFKLFFTPI